MSGHRSRTLAGGQGQVLLKREQQLQRSLETERASHYVRCGGRARTQKYRSRDKNREQALERLRALVRSVAVTRRKRIPTRPTRSSRQKRLESKTARGRIKALRGRVVE